MSGQKLHMLLLMLQPMLQPLLMFPGGASNLAALLEGWWEKQLLAADFCSQHIPLCISHVASRHGSGVGWVLRLGARAGHRGNAEKLNRVGAKYSAQE